MGATIGLAILGFGLMMGGIIAVLVGVLRRAAELRRQAEQEVGECVASRREDARRRRARELRRRGL